MSSMRQRMLFLDKLHFLLSFLPLLSQRFAQAEEARLFYKKGLSLLLQFAPNELAPYINVIFPTYTQLCTVVNRSFDAVQAIRSV